MRWRGPLFRPARRTPFFRPTSVSTLPAVLTRDQTKPGERLEVELPVCRSCGLVGKLPAGLVLSRIKGFCLGPHDEPHKKRKMELVRFEEAQ